MQPAGSHDELAAEAEAVERIEAAHRAHVRAARRYATGLAEEASYLSEEGPRETEAESGDEDGESAAEAATARAASARAVLAWKRVRELEGAGRALAFGRITGEDGTTYIGRMSVIDGGIDGGIDGDIDGDEVHLVDWRAAAAMPFYRATPLEPLGVTHRRHLHYTDGRLTNYSDEVFDEETLRSAGHLRGEAALLAALTSRTDGRMKAVVATIQAEQDAVIRASERGPLLVQGGPGTGKTVVALHRAAYLLYADRAALAETGVLIVGPSPEFLTYISDVLPSLGESGVVSMTIDQLHPGVRPVPDASLRAAELKGSAAMIKFLEAAVADRQRTPTEPLIAWYGSRRITVAVDDLAGFFTRAQRHRTHNAGAGSFRTQILDLLVADVHEPGFGEATEVRESLRSSREVRRFIERHWPVLTPEQALNDLLGSPALLRSAARAAGLSDDERELLAETRTPESELSSRRWQRSDVPLLDELHHLLGDVGEADALDAEMEHVIADEWDVFALAEAGDLEGDDVSDADSDVDPDVVVALDQDSEFGEVDRYDAWREGDEEATWR